MTMLEDLREVVRLGSSATPGQWAQHPQAKGAVHSPQFECWIPQGPEDARLIAESVNFIRTHAAQIERDTRDAERFRWHWRELPLDYWLV